MRRLLLRGPLKRPLLLRVRLMLRVLRRRKRHGSAASGGRLRAYAAPSPTTALLPRAVGAVVGAEARTAVLATRAATAGARADGRAAAVLAISRLRLAVCRLRVRRHRVRALNGLLLLL